MTQHLALRKEVSSLGSALEDATRELDRLLDEEVKELARRDRRGFQSSISRRQLVRDVGSLFFLAVLGTLLMSRLFWTDTPETGLDRVTIWIGLFGCVFFIVERLWQMYRRRGSSST